MHEKETAIGIIADLMRDGIPRDRNQVSDETGLEKAPVSKSLYSLEVSGLLYCQDPSARPKKYAATAVLLGIESESDPTKSPILVDEHIPEEIEITDLAESAILHAEDWTPPACMIVRPADAEAMRRISRLLSFILNTEPFTAYLDDVATRMEQAL